VSSEVRRKKLCIIIPAHWAAIMGGSQYQAKVLIDALIEMDQYEIFYIANRVNPEFQPVGYKIIEIAGSKGLRRFGAFFDTLKLLRILGEIQPDVIYQRVGCGYTGIAAYYARRHGCRMIWHVAHDRTLDPAEYRRPAAFPFGGLERKMLDYGIKRAHQIVTQSKHQQELLQANYGRAATAVIPNFHPLPEEEISKESRIKVVWVANLKEWKRPEMFVRLANDLRHLENAEFLMIGSAEFYGAHYKKFVDNVAQATNLTYLGGRKQEEVNQIIAKSHIFVNTSCHEGFANTFIQAWMRRVPVVSMDVDPDGVLGDEGVGFFANGNYDALRDSVERLATDDNLRNAMGIRAQEYAFSQHSQANIQRLVDIIEDDVCSNLFGDDPKARAV
jgi:glycosyltransferase involved in cell wall biosynthesis